MSPSEAPVAAVSVYADIMLEHATVLREAWHRSLDELAVRDVSSVLVGGPLAEPIGDTVPMAIADEVADLVVLGEGPVLPDEATVAHTGLPDDSFDAVVMLEAWRAPAQLAAVTAEAKRIVRPGGRVWLGRPDLDALLDSTPATHRASLLYGPHRDQIRSSLSVEAIAPTELALVRAGFEAVESWGFDLPVAAFDDAASYVAAIDGGLWLGIDRVTPTERAGVIDAVARSLADDDFPLVETQPWVLGRGVRPE